MLGSMWVDLAKSVARHQERIHCRELLFQRGSEVALSVSVSRAHVFSLVCDDVIAPFVVERCDGGVLP